VLQSMTCLMMDAVNIQRVAALGVVGDKKAS
jgi:hypothetical protein